MTQFWKNFKARLARNAPKRGWLYRVASSLALGLTFSVSAAAQEWRGSHSPHKFLLGLVIVAILATMAVLLWRYFHGASGTDARRPGSLSDDNWLEERLNTYVCTSKPGYKTGYVKPYYGYED